MKARPPHAQWIIGASAIAAWLITSLYAPSSWLKALVISGPLLVVPGYLLLRLLAKNSWTSKFWASLSYSAALSALWLMLIGLGVNTLLPALGLSHPLTNAPLAIASALSVALLLALCQIYNRNLFTPPSLPSLSWSQKGLVLYGALLPILSAGGAISITNNGSNIFALFTLVAIAIYIVLLVWPKGQKNQPLFAYALFTTSLALLLGTSLRGWNITGHDIIQEFQVFELTNGHALWSMSHLQDAYNACLSITILPTLLARVAGLNDLYVFKLAFQTIFALIPAILYLTLVRFVPSRIAFLAGFVFISFPTFMTDMPMLNRQEIAFIFFSLLCMAIFDNRLQRQAKSAIILLLGLGMILSHYSTSYVAIGILLLAKFLELAILIWSKLRKQPTSRRTIWMPVSWTITAILLLLVYFWNSQITHTSQGITRTLNGIVMSLPRLVDNSAKTGQDAYSLLGKAPTNQQLFQQYQATTIQSRDLPGKEYYSPALLKRYPLQPAAETVEPITRLGQQLAAWHVPLYAAYDFVRNGYAKLIQVLIIIGLVALAFHPKLLRLPRQYYLLGLACLLMIGLQVALPSSVIDYGLLRLLQQSLLFLALPVVLACYLIAGWLRIPPDWRYRLIAIAFASFFTVLSGLLPALTGGFKPALNTDNSGFYYQAYDTHADEIAGYHWLAASIPFGSIVNTDAFSRRKMMTYAGIVSRQTLAPDAIATGAYVYLSHGDVQFNAIPVYAGPSLIYQQPPTAFLNSQKDLLYSAGDVRIYK